MAHIPHTLSYRDALIDECVEYAIFTERSQLDSGVWSYQSFAETVQLDGGDEDIYKAAWELFQDWLKDEEVRRAEAPDTSEMTLEDCYRYQSDVAEYEDIVGDSYTERLARKKQELIEYLSDKLAEGVRIDVTADAFIETAEEMGNIRGNEISGEISGRYTRDGNPIPLTI